jgi:hypothetical protein
MKFPIRILLFAFLAIAFTACGSPATAATNDWKK